MAMYYVHQRTTVGDGHELHRAGCDCMQWPREPLGDFESHDSAFSAATKRYGQVSACWRCLSTPVKRGPSAGSE